MSDVKRYMRFCLLLPFILIGMIGEMVCVGVMIGSRLMSALLERYE